ncbi:uncharacterized protein UHOD_12233 [Ustilago sp. UG-2017b]|nr:uncharacterized protein UHOD_12233 [Ustilago sp. UG-2017b]
MEPRPDFTPTSAKKLSRNAQARAAKSERMQPNDHSPDRLTRPRSRGRAGFVGSNAEQLPRHNNRSSSRASFLGRPRQCVYQIYEGENAADNGGTHRWRSESRTVRGSTFVPSCLGV